MAFIQEQQTPEESLASLSELKASLEAQIEAEGLVLETNNVTMSTPLIDAQGFPLADVDIPSVRKARIRILELRNDLETCVGEVAKAIEDVYASRAAATVASENANAKGAVASIGGAGEMDVDVDGCRNERTKSGEERRPFARVDGVAPESPAHAAGLIREDLIVSVAVASDSTTVSVSTVENPMARLVSLVGSSENRPLQLRVLRRTSIDGTTTDASGESLQLLTLTLTPKKWTGRGLLGCHIVPHTARFVSS